MSTTGEVDVTATTTATIVAKGVATAVSISIGGAGAGVQTMAVDNVVTQAYLSTGANVTANAGGLKVEAQSTPNISAESDGGTAGILAIGVTETTADLQGATKAYVGEGVTVHVGSTGITVSATENDPTGSNTNAANATTTLVSIGAAKGVTDMNATANFGSYLVNPGDIVEMDGNDTAGGTVGHWYQYLGTSHANLVLANTNFSNTADWKDLGLHGSSLPTDKTNQPGATSTFVNPGDIVEKDANNTSGITGDWYRYIGPAATLDLTTTNFNINKLWEDLGANGAQSAHGQDVHGGGRHCRGLPRSRSGHHAEQRSDNAHEHWHRLGHFDVDHQRQRQRFRRDRRRHQCRGFLLHYGRRRHDGVLCRRQFDR